MNIERIFGLNEQYINQDVFGLELEIEAVRLAKDIPPFWASKADGSLRNNGVEFVSEPLHKDFIQVALKQLFATLKLSSESYSERTSIHVHCNVKGLNSDQIKAICLAYMLTENFFFNFVNESRRGNIFCVAVQDFDSPTRLKNIFVQPHFPNRLRGWEKYSAFNILPIEQFGTIEFRHLHGTNDIDTICMWVDAIGALKNVWKQMMFPEMMEEVLKLNTTSEYRNFTEKVLGGVPQQFFKGIEHSDYKRFMYKPVMVAKTWYMAEEEHRENAAKLGKAKKTVAFAGLPPDEMWQRVQAVPDFFAQLDPARAQEAQQQVVRPARARPPRVPVPEPVEVPQQPARDQWADLLAQQRIDQEVAAARQRLRNAGINVNPPDLDA